MADNKTKPAEIICALTVLENIKATEAPARYAHLRRILPALAMQLARNGENVTTDLLLDHINQGDDHLEKLKTTPQKRRYEDVVKNFPPAPLSQLKRFYKAVEKGDLKAVETPGPADRNDSNTLRLAAKNGHLDIVKYLLDQGADIHARDDIALRQAAQNGHLKIVKYLVKKGADIHARDDSIPRFAAYNGQTGDHALRLAAKNDHLQVVKHLLDHGADIHADHDGSLRWAAQDGHLDIVKYLLDQDADIHARDDIALRLAAANGHLKVVKYLVKNGANIHADSNYSLSYAAQNGHLKTVKYLVKKGADIHGPRGRDTALHLAATKGHLQVVKYLVDHGADIHSSVDSALRFAAANGHLKVVQYLLDHYADRHAGYNEALRAAAGYGKLETAAYLVENGADIGTLSLHKGKRLTRFITQKQLWLQRHKHLKTISTTLADFSPHFFHQKTYEAVKNMLTQEGHDGNTLEKYSYHISGLFKSEDRVLQYLEKWGQAGKQPLHDIGQKIELPQEGRPDLKAWGDAVLQHGPKLAQYVGYADRLNVPLKSACGTKWSLRKTKAELAKHAYKNGHRDPKLAAFCFDHGWQEGKFDKLLGKIEEYKSQYPANDNQKSEGLIPDIKIDGAKFGKENYQFYKLPDGDVRGLLLGEFTNCCQHLGGEGSKCAKHGFMSENGGFYVIADKKTDQIVGQSWVWRGSKGELVFDSLESLKGHFEEDHWESLSKTFAQAVEKNNTAKISSIHIGRGGATPKRLPFPKMNCAEPIDYKGYRDSKKQQYLVWKAP